MPPKKPPSRQKATTQPRAATPVGAKRSTSKATTKQAGNRAVAQLSPIGEDFDDSDDSDGPQDFDDFEYYQQWVRRADNDDLEVSLPTIRAEWEGLPEDCAAAFAGAVRDFQVDEGVKASTETELHKILQKVSNFELGDPRHDRRRTTRGAANLHKALVKALGLWDLATEPLLSRLDAVDTAVTTMPQEGLRSLLETYQRRLRDSIQLAQTRISSWIQVFNEFTPDQLWTSENIRKFQNSARNLESDLTTVRSSLEPPTESSSSPSKRKRNDDAEGSSSKVPRRSRDLNVTHSGSAKSGAARSQHHPSRPATTQDQGQASGEEFVEQNVAAPKLQPSQGPRRPRPDGASITATYTPLHSPSDHPNAMPHPHPLPTTGEAAGPWTERLLEELEGLSQSSHSSFLSWCCRQFTIANYHTLEECEPLANAVYQFFRRTLRDHDWENESDIPPLPMTAQDLHYFTIGVGNGRMWGNFRRLFNVRLTAALSFREYCRRNLGNGQVYFDNADVLARQILQSVKVKGLSHDWGNEVDIVENYPSYEITKDIPIRGLNRNGYWNFRGMVGEGGNGRALLYCKYDSAGNILQRLISKEIFVTRYWNWLSFWSGPVANRIPVEAGLHRLFPRDPHIIEFLGFHVSKQLRMVRIYTAFAELGDLASFYDNHERRANAVDEHGVALPPPSIPVVAIIYMFQAMAAGACLMAHGAVPDDEGHWPGDQPPVWDHSIIHRDIKPLNYFISSSESPVVWPKLPIVALGDFGNAIDEADPLFAQSVHELGTPGWMAPEQFPNVPAACPVSPKTNVYQIGLTVLQLMHLKNPRVQAKHGINDRPFPGFSNDSLFYPQELINIAEDCIQMDPADRPTPVGLYKSIRDLATGYPDPSSKTTPWQLQEIPPNQLLRTSLDRWAV